MLRVFNGIFAEGIMSSVHIDFTAFAETLRRSHSVTNFVYYNIVPRFEDEFPKRRLLDWLSYNGYLVREKYGKTVTRDSRTFLRGSVSLDITIDALEVSDKVDGLIILTNDVNMCAAIRSLHRKTTWVAVVTWINDVNLQIDSQLRRTADKLLRLDLGENT
ncbi:hypothetical protein Q669_20530 [Labrenzia sp. C1B10]|nr:hypothetical protein Q669_20530 [Labrenzia sp. C1B10]ERS03306.1 hypothetical protein Q675_04685 [Labrenzia sp. C1B70]